MATITLNPQYLSGNTVVARASFPAGESMKYVVFFGPTPVFSGYLYAMSEPVDFDLSELFVHLKYTMGTQRVYIRLYDEEGVEQASATSEIYGGGIHKLLARKLLSLGTNIFSAKISSTYANFLLSTRSFGPFLYIPENELMPLFFYKKNKSFTLKGNGQTLYSASYGSLTEDAVDSINLNYIRLGLFQSSGVLCNTFQIFSGRPAPAVTIVITEARERMHFIRFKNSLCAFEMVGLDDAVTAEGEFTADTGTVWDEEIQDFIRVQIRKKFKNRFSASITPKTNQEYLWLIDMLLSPEQYFVVNGSEYRCNVTSEKPVFQNTTGEPVTMPIQIELVDNDLSFSPTNNQITEKLSIFNANYNEIFY